MSISPLQLGALCLLPFLAQSGAPAGHVQIQPLFEVPGESSFDNFGFSISPISDIDGDGVRDILVGAPNRKPGYSLMGHAYVVSGATGAILRKHDGINPSDRFGHAAALLPDLNGDNVPEYAVGAIWAVDLDHGQQADMPGMLTVYDGATGALLKHHAGFGKYECHGAAIAPLADMNGDGIPDFAVSARFGGAIDGNPKTAPGYVRILSGADYSVLHEVHGKNPGDFLGETMIAIPDIDGDGKPDLAVGAYSYPALAKRGQVLLISSATGAVLREIDGDKIGDWFGWAIAVVPDVDGDGVRDLAIGAPKAHEHTGLVAIVSSMTGARLATIVGKHPMAQSGHSLASVGDVDGDSLSDLVVGSPIYRNESGRVDVVSIPSGVVLGSMDGASEEITSARRS